MSASGSVKSRERRRRAKIRQAQEATLPRLIEVEFLPEMTVRRTRSRSGAPRSCLVRYPLNRVVPNIEDLILKTARVAAHHDLDIFRDGPITFRVRTFRKYKLGDAVPYRVINLYVWRTMPEGELVDTIAHELRHIGQFARGQYSERVGRGQKAYEHDPIEIDARGFARMVRAEIEREAGPSCSRPADEFFIKKSDAPISRRPRW